MNNILADSIISISTPLNWSFKNGEFMILKARQSGKSMLNSYYSTLMKNPHNKTHWPYTYDAYTQPVFEIERWCYRNFKSRNWRNRGGYFAFKKEKDYAFFLLKWS